MKIILCIVDSVGEWLFQEYLKRYPDSFAHEMMNNGIYFSNNYSACCHSYPSYPSILMGCYPYEHGILGKFGFKLNKKIDTIHDFVIKNGYSTHSYSEQSWMFNGQYGYDIKADNMRYFNPNLKYKDNSFVFVNFWNTHLPWQDWDKVESGIEYNRPHIVDMRKAYNENDLEKIEEIRENWIKRCLRNLDRNFQVLKKMHKNNPDAKIIFTADHGDDYCFNGVPTHGSEIYDTIAKVPLLVYPYKKNEFTHVCSSTQIKVFVEGIIMTAAPLIIHPEKVYSTSEDIENLVHIIGIKYSTGDKYEFYLKSAYLPFKFFKFIYKNNNRELLQETDITPGIHEILTHQYPYLFDEKKWGQYVYRARINKK